MSDTEAAPTVEELISELARVRGGLDILETYVRVASGDIDSALIDFGTNLRAAVHANLILRQQLAALKANGCDKCVAGYRCAEQVK